MGLTNTQKIVFGLVVFILFFIGWGLYPLFFKWLMIGIGSKEKLLKDFGSLGDIYGSLTALFTSATLIIVLYSAYLQREANKDTRDAMAAQLQQARDATAKQLRQARKAVHDQIEQAREATAQQLAHAKALSDIQLNHAKEVAIKQLELTQLTHDAQIKESQNSIFANQFYFLLNYKKDKFDSIELFTRTDERAVKGLGILQILTENFINTLNENPEFYNNYDENKMRMIFFDICSSLFSGSISPLISYFYVYKNLIKLIDSKLVIEEKALYIDILSNSMFQEEQIILFWITPFFPDLKRSIDNSRLLNQIWYDESLKSYAIKFHEPLTFRVKKWHKFFEENELKNPT